MAPLNRFIFSSLLLASLPLSSAFYLPGVAPTSYDKEQIVPLHVNRLTPGIARHDDQLHAVLSFDYYREAFHFCQPKDGPSDVKESLGSILFGDRIQTSPFELHMAKNETCKAVCGEVTFPPRDARFTNNRIAQGYNINWLVDGLPAAQLNVDAVTGKEFYSPGFLLGSIDDNGQPLLHNHYDILIDYHLVGLPTSTKYRVVGVLVQPESRGNSKIGKDGKVGCGEDGPPMILNEEGETKVTWTYSVYWRESPTAWATRWDKYLHVYDPKIHWFSLINSSVFVVFLVGMVSVILLRALRKDIARYNRLDAIGLDDLNGTSAAIEDGIQEDSGWKLVHGDVFRCPRSPLLLSMLLGNGAQLFVMTAVTVGKWTQNVSVIHDSNLCCSVCAVWFAFAFEPRPACDDNSHPVHFVGFCRWIRVCTLLQGLWRRGMETEHHHDASIDPWIHLRSLFLAELVCLGQGIQWCSAVYHYGRRCRDLVHYQCTAELRW